MIEYVDHYDKYILFELMSGLKVNYYKSSLVGVNISQRWIEEATNILNC